MKIDHCRACHAPIVFLKTRLAFMPCDASSVREEDTQFDHTRHVTHFSTCTSPGEFRRRQHTAKAADTPKPAPKVSRTESGWMEHANVDPLGWTRSKR